MYRHYISHVGHITDMQSKSSLIICAGTSGPSTGQRITSSGQGASQFTHTYTDSFGYLDAGVPLKPTSSLTIVLGSAYDFYTHHVLFSKKRFLHILFQIPPMTDV